MRNVNTALLGSITALVILTVPVAASTTDQKTADPRQTGEKSASSPCVSYQQKPDGTWAALACQEVGAPAQSQPRPEVHSNATH
jgi:hypothetical protein